MSPPRPYFDHSEEEQDGAFDAQGRKRSSRACDQCRKTKSKCERTADDNAPCKTCTLNNTACTFLGPSYKRGPPKGYIHAIELRWHHVESVLGAIIASNDPRAQGIIHDLRKDDLAREILNRVDAGPFGPSGRHVQRAGSTKEDFFASILNSSGAGRDAAHAPAGRESRSRRQSRVSREIVSSSADAAALPAPTLEWQDRLSARLSHGHGSGYVSSSSSASGYQDLYQEDASGRPSAQRRRLNGPAQPDWNGLYTMDGASDSDDEHSRQDDEDNAVGMGQLSLDENSEVRYHGKASGLHLLGSRLDNRQDGGVWKLPMAGVWPPSTVRPHRLLEEDEIDVRLPPIAEQDELVQLYFVYVHPVFPIVHKQRFLAEYEAHKTGSPTVSEEDRGRRSGTPMMSRQLSKVLLLAMFALAARYREPGPVQRGAMWEEGCNHAIDAREILNKIYHHSRPSTCQALLLLGLYECAVGSMEHGWLFIGMATRMAEDLGMNRAADRWQHHGVELFTPVDIQIRRLIWWGCCIADTYVSVYMGRPVAIGETDYDTTLPDIPEDDDAPWQHPVTEPYKPEHPPVSGRIMACFRAVAQLVLIIGEIVKQVYPVRYRSRVPKRVKLQELETRLDQWFIDLPENLRYDTSSKRVVPPPHVLLLHIRYWSAVLLLHRAFIPRPRGTLTPLGGTGDHDTLSLKAFDLCQGAATHISTIVTIYEENFGLRRSPLFISSYLLSAGIMHIVTLTLRQSNVQASLGLRQCIFALEKMEMIWPSASRAKDLLSGANVQFQGTVTPYANGPDRYKRPADDGHSAEKGSELLQREAFGTVDKTRTPPGSAIPEVSNRLMAHMLGLDIPGVQPSTSYFPGYEWWPPINPLASPVVPMSPVQAQHAQQMAQMQQQQQLQQQQPRMAHLAPMMEPPQNNDWLQTISNPTPAYSYGMSANQRRDI